MTHPRSNEPADELEDRSRTGPQFGGAAALRRSRIMANYSMVGLFVLALLVVLYHIGDFMVPVIGAILLNLILSPITRTMHRLHIPYPVSAVVIVVTLFALVAAGFYGLSSPISRWISAIPEAVAKIEAQMEDMGAPLQTVRRATSEVEKITSGGDGDSRTTEPERVVVRQPSLTTRIFGSVTNMVLQTGLMFVLLYFLLAVGNLFQSKLIRIMPRLRDKLKAQHMAAAVVHDISIYLATITLINAVLGTAVGLALFALDFPNPLLWGVMAGLLNYVPYLGAVVGVSIVAVASFISIEPASAAILPPLSYAAINILEGQFITPSIVSRNLTLNPVVVFLSVSFFSWFWGIPGALMAVPILVIIKILSDYIVTLQPIGEFLSGWPPKPALPPDPTPATADNDSET